ncbi:MAG: glutaredoxin family protein [Anaerolineales bacterium]
MSESIIRVYGTNWCGDCIRAKQFFQKHQIPYEWVDIDRDKEAERIVMEINHGNRSVPTIVLPDGNILVEPSNSELEEKLLSKLGSEE